MILADDRKVMVNKLGTTIITLPKKWIEANGIKKGDMIKELCSESIVILIAPNSPLLLPDNLIKLKHEILSW